MRFPALDGIRALAVTMVFAFHYGGGAHGGVLMRVVNAVRLQGWAGVDVFFVLSGFLITGVLYDTREDSEFFRRFYARRCCVIFPVYHLVAVVLVVLTPVVFYSVAIVASAVSGLSGQIFPVGLCRSFIWCMLGLRLRMLILGIFGRCVLRSTSICCGRCWFGWCGIGFGCCGLLRVCVWLQVLLLRCWMVFGGVDLRGGWLLTMLPFSIWTLC